MEFRFVLNYKKSLRYRLVHPTLLQRTQMILARRRVIDASHGVDDRWIMGCFITKHEQIEIYLPHIYRQESIDAIPNIIAHEYIHGLIDEMNSKTRGISLQGEERIVARMGY